MALNMLQGQEVWVVLSMDVNEKRHDEAVEVRGCFVNRPTPAEALLFVAKQEWLADPLTFGDLARDTLTDRGARITEKTLEEQARREARDFVEGELHVVVVKSRVLWRANA